MTEDSLVAALRAVCEAPVPRAPRPRAVVLGIGDDAAAWQPSRSHRSVITTDVLVDGVHFFGSSMRAGDVGRRAMAANLSDIAAMGARPVLATVGLALNDATAVDWLVDAYRGMAAVARQYGAQIVGGDVVRSPVLTFAVTVVGEVSPRRLKRRDGGRQGDVLAVTGPLGASRAGLELLRNEALQVDADSRATALATFSTPVPRLPDGQWLATRTAVHAMMDCSDGLSTDVGRLAVASGCGALLERVPVHEAARAVSCAAGADAAEWALHGGEDFELLVAVEKRAFEWTARAYARRFGRGLERIGTLTVAPGVYALAADGVPRALAAGGWDHLAANAQKGGVSSRA